MRVVFKYDVTGQGKGVIVYDCKSVVFHEDGKVELTTNAPLPITIRPTAWTTAEVDQHAAPMG